MKKFLVILVGLVVARLLKRSAARTRPRPPLLEYKGSHGSRSAQPGTDTNLEDDEVDEASKASFPASDPPARW